MINATEEKESEESQDGGLHLTQAARGLTRS